MYFIKAPKYEPSDEEQYSCSTKNNEKGKQKEKQYYEAPIIYEFPKLDYLVERELSNQDFTNRAPNKQVRLFDNSYAGPGLLGFTYLMGPEISLNKDKVYLDPMLHLEVSVHELAHRNDEGETREVNKHRVDFRPAKYKPAATPMDVEIFKKNYWNKKTA